MQLFSKNAVSQFSMHFRELKQKHGGTEIEFHLLKIFFDARLKIYAIIFISFVLTACFIEFVIGDQQSKFKFLSLYLTNL